MKSLKLLIFLFFVILTPIAYAKEECEDINDILKNRWPWKSGVNHYKVYQYPLATKLISEYNAGGIDNSKYLTYVYNQPTSKFNRGTWLSVKKTWKDGAVIWLPEPTYAMGSLLYLYPNIQLNDIKWAEYEVKCKKEAKDKFEYTVASNDDSLWSIWLSVREKNKVSWLEFLELNKHIGGVEDLVIKIKNGGDASKDVILIKTGDKIKTGTKEYLEEAKQMIRSVDIPIESTLKSFANSNQYFLDTQKIFSFNAESNLGDLLNKKKVLVKIFTTSPAKIGTFSVPQIADFISGEIEDNFLKSNPNHKVIIMVLMKPDITKEKEVRKTVSVRSFNLGINDRLVYGSFFEAAGIDISSQRIFGSINEVLKSEEKLMQFLNLLIEKETALQEERAPQDTSKKRIIIDPGHGRVCYDGKLQTRGRSDQETRLNTRFSLELKELVESAFGDSIEVILTREDDNFDPGNVEGVNDNKIEGKNKKQLHKINRLYASCFNCIKYQCINLKDPECKENDKEFYDCISDKCDNYCLTKEKYFKQQSNPEIQQLIEQGSTKANMFLSIHHNSCPAQSKLCYGPKVISAKGYKDFSAKICEGLIKVYNKYKTKDMPIRTIENCNFDNEEYPLLVQAAKDGIPGIIIEVGFMDTKSLKEINLIGLDGPMKSLNNEINPNLLSDKEEPSRSFRYEMQREIVNALRGLLNIEISRKTTDKIDLSKYGKIAVILDDGGHRNDDIQIINALHQKEIPLTFALIPGCPNTQEVAEKIENSYNNYEIILHQPMEAESKQTPECRLDTTPKRGIYNVNKKEDVNRRVSENINLIKSYLKEGNKFVGLNNHQGSLVTQNKELMSEIGKIMEANNLIFIDSLTTLQNRPSVAYDVIKNAGVKSFKKDFFIDTDNRVLETQFNKLEQTAINKGTAVGIGHFDIKTINDLISYLNNNYQIVDDNSLGHKTYINKDSNKKIKLVLVSELPYELKSDVVDLQEPSLKSSALLRISELKDGRLPDDSLFIREVACANGVIILMDYVFGFGTSCDLKIFSEDAWKQRDIIESIGGEIIKSKDIDYTKLMPGSIIGVYYSESSYNSRSKNEGSGYTHLGFYLGDGKILHKYPGFRIDTVESLNKGKFKIIEALVPPINILNKERHYETELINVDEDITPFLDKLSVPDDLKELFVAEIVRINDIKDGYNIPFERSKKNVHIPILNFCGINVHTPSILKESNLYSVNIPVRTYGIRVMEKVSFSKKFGENLEKGLEELKQKNKDIYDKLEVTSSVRTFEKQKQLRKNSPSLAAKEGTSEHELGIAVDINSVPFTTNEMNLVIKILEKNEIVRTQPDEIWHFALKPDTKEEYIAMLKKQDRLGDNSIIQAAGKLYGDQEIVRKNELNGVELISFILDSNKNYITSTERDPDSINEWSINIYNAMIDSKIDINPETVSIVVSIIAQESNFNPLPFGYDLSTMCQQLPKKCKLGYCLDGIKQCDKIFGRHTGKIEGKEFAKALLNARNGKLNGGVLIDNYLWPFIAEGIMRDVEVSMGPMQIKSFRVKEIIAEEVYGPYYTIKQFEDIELDNQIFEDIFSIKGGLKYGINYFKKIYDEYFIDNNLNNDNLLWIFADYNSGIYSSRNARLQYELYRILNQGENPPKDYLDGDMLSWKAAYHPNELKSNTQKDIEKIAIMYPDHDWGDVRKQLELEKKKEFENTALYKIIKAEYRKKYGESIIGKVPIAETSHIKLGGFKWSAKEYTDRISEKFNNFCDSVECNIFDTNKKIYYADNIKIIGGNPSALGISVNQFYRYVYSDWFDTSNPLSIEKELPLKTKADIELGFELRKRFEEQYDLAFLNSGLGLTSRQEWHPILDGRGEFKNNFVSPGHEALDIFIEEGSFVYSPINGIVIAKGDNWKGYYSEDELVWEGNGLTPKAGNAVVIYNPDEKGYFWISHLQEGILVETGEIIKKGQVIGKVGNSGSAYKEGHGEHIHLAYKIEYNYQNKHVFNEHKKLDDELGKLDTYGTLRGIDPSNGLLLTQNTYCQTQIC